MSKSIFTNTEKSRGRKASAPPYFLLSLECNCNVLRMHDIVCTIAEETKIALSPRVKRNSVTQFLVLLGPTKSPPFPGVFLRGNSVGGGGGGGGRGLICLVCQSIAELVWVGWAAPPCRKRRRRRRLFLWPNALFPPFVGTTYSCQVKDLPSESESRGL